MKIFLDTSSLFKLYHREAGTALLEAVFSEQRITAVFLSEISKIEFASTIWKKVRVLDITAAEAQMTLSLCEADFGKYTFVATDSFILEQARSLISKYGQQGLRTLDSIQLSTSVALAQQADLFLTADKLLNTFFAAEGLGTDLPTE